MTTPIPLVASLLSLGVAACATSPAQPGAQAPAPAPGAALGSEWAPLRPLIGAWSGTGGDAAHPSRGGFTMAPDRDCTSRGSDDHLSRSRWWIASIVFR